MTKKDKMVPKSLQNPNKWRMQRRGFLQLMLGAAMVSQIPWWVSCKLESSADFTLDGHQLAIIKRVQSFLFPSDGNGPGADELNASDYLQWVLNDEGMDKDEKGYLIKGIAWVEETAREEMEDGFLNLEEHRQNEILTLIANEDWGEAWYSMNLTFVFEALLSDPIYGSNREGMGWKWLEHNPGQPRPIEEMQYGHFLQYINQHKPS